MNNRSGKTRYIVLIAMFSAIATVLMLFEFPLPFAPSFYELDFSEVPVLIGGFTLGPVAGVVIEAIKILLNFVINGTITAGVGELGNFIIGCSYILPACLFYKYHRTRKGAVIGLVLGTVSIGIVGMLVNAFLLLPVYAMAFGIDLEVIIGMGTAINPAIDGIWMFCLLAVLPFNLLKGAIDMVVTLLIYKPLRRIIK